MGNVLAGLSLSVDTKELMACETNTPCTSEVLRSLEQKYPATKPSPPEFEVGFQPQMSGPDRDAPPSPSASRRIYCIFVPISDKAGNKRKTERRLSTVQIT